MTEKLDLGRLAKLAVVHRKEGTPFVSVTPDEIDSLIARIRALESRASNAGGAVGTVDYSCSGSVRWREGLTQGNFPDGTPLYTHPAPASKEPVADERAAFEAKFPMPADCVRCGDGYAATDYNAWTAHEYCQKWRGWQARASLDGRREG